MATIQEAAKSAMAFALESLGAERTKGIRLEEIESAMEGGLEVWRITLSMPDSSPMSFFAAAGGLRDYKTFAVVKATGEVLSMKIRELSKA